MEALIQRAKDIINICWDSFSAKVGGGIIEINKEASIQLNFAYLLKNTIDLSLHNLNESISIELETGLQVNGRYRECDVVVRLKKNNVVRFLPIELKCYKYLASSGGKRGAVDIFYKDVYSDLELLESYTQIDGFLSGIQLTMTDFRNLPFPPKRSGKYINYDITHGARVDDGVHLTTPIGGKNIEIILTGSYHFNWVQVGQFYFLKLENQAN
jgi:hypothetical protein